MYKPLTVEQYKVYQYLKEQFVLEYFLLFPLSRSALILEDRSGARIAFSFQDGTVRETEIPPPAPLEERKAFITYFKALNPRPNLKTFEDVTRWWLDHPNPLTHQQALGLKDSLYRRYLSHRQLDDEEVYALAAKGLVTESEYSDILLWYLDGHTGSCWLGPLGLDGTGDIYGLTLRYRTPDAEELTFYLLNDYYREMNHMWD